MRRWLMIGALFVLGLALVIYPRIDQSVQERKQQRLLTEWSELQSLKALSAQAAGRSQGTGSRSSQPPNEAGDPRSKELQNLELDGMTMLGTIQIPAIDAYDPILSDATNASLRVGIGRVGAEGYPGEAGNLALAGHRSFTYGKQFSRLNELNEGDEIILESAENRYTYRVTSVFLVEPDDLSVLEGKEGAYELTLITCHPARNPTHRLIVKAEMDERLEREPL